LIFTGCWFWVAKILTPVERKTSKKYVKSRIILLLLAFKFLDLEGRTLVYSLIAQGKNEDLGGNPNSINILVKYLS